MSVSRPQYSTRRWLARRIEVRPHAALFGNSLGVESLTTSLHLEAPLWTWCLPHPLILCFVHVQAILSWVDTVVGPRNVRLQSSDDLQHLQLLCGRNKNRPMLRGIDNYAYNILAVTPRKHDSRTSSRCLCHTWPALSMRSP